MLTKTCLLPLFGLLATNGALAKVGRYPLPSDPSEIRLKDEPHETRRIETRPARRLQSETRTVRHLQEDAAFSGDEPTVDAGVFVEPESYPAQDLDFFKKQMDPEEFEWINPDEIVPGATTCGWLKPTLGSRPDVVYPVIEVYVCMRFANTQPAKKGYIFVHCGGPSSLSSCVSVEYMAGDLGEQNLNDYNVLAIDQRGMGRSWPSFAHEECFLGSLSRNETNGELIAEANPDAYPTNYLDVEIVKASLQPWKERVVRCWTCATCNFTFTVPAEDGSNKTNNFHFLEFSGTRELAEDIERMRMALNATKMSVYGISYGTGVFGMYATMFPNTVDKFVIDSNVSPFPNLKDMSEPAAIATNERIDYLIYSCTAQNIQNPGSCPVDDMRVCINAGNDLFKDEGAGQGLNPYQENFIKAMFVDFKSAPALCEAAITGDLEMVLSLIDEVLGRPVDSTTARQMVPNPESGPTYPENVFGNPDYYALMSSDIPQMMVRAQDYAGASFNDEFFAKEIVQFAQKYDGAGTQQPANTYFILWVVQFYWPKGVPIAPFGSPHITGIISGQLFDRATPYRWTQEMRQAFQNTNLLTSQDISHGIDATPNQGCLRLMMEYFEIGYPNFTDGTICGADFAAPIAFACAAGLCV